jgi:hypothetical protein
MKVHLKQLLPADLSNETAFQLVQFVRGLAFALESIYFDNMLLHTSECEPELSPVEDNENGNPF